MMKKFALWAFAFLILGMALVSSSVVVQNYSLQDSYSGGELISGWINMSFSGQANTNFTNSFNGSVSLMDLLSKTGYANSEDYTCKPSNCADGYVSSNPEPSKTVNPGEGKIIGLSISGGEASILDFSMKIGSSAANSCSNQVKIDLFDDGDYEFYNNNYVDQPCGTENYGCFSSSGSQYSSLIQENIGRYCENISLPAAPAYRVGARVRSTANSDKKIYFNLYDSNWQLLNETGCTVNGTAAGDQKISCLIAYPAKKTFNSFVCVSAESGANYTIRTETVSPCGKIFYGDNIDSTFTRDYEIYAYPLIYGQVSSTFDSGLYERINSGKNLIDDLNQYIETNYGGNCNPECVIPMKISGPANNAVLSDIALNYGAAGSVGISDDKIYDVSKNAFIINSSYLKFDLEDFNITVPNANGNRTFHLNFGGNTIISKQISISSGFDFDIFPKFAFVAKDTLFSINASNVTSSSWNFGDGGTAKINGSQVTYNYADTGNYELKVTAVKANGESSTKTFKIVSGNAKESANFTITDYESRIKTLDGEINSYPSWIQDELENNLNLSAINSSLAEIRSEFNSASSDENYTDVMQKLLELDVPYSLTVSQSGKDLPILIGIDNIDTSLIQEISNTNLAEGQNDKLKSDIVSWLSENYDATLSYEVVSEVTESGKEPILTKVKVSISPKTGSEPAYLIINYPKSSIKFAEDYGAKDLGEGSAVYIQISGSKTIEFLVPEEVSVEQLGAYMSPGISELGTYEEIQEAQGAKFRTGLFFLWLGILIIVFAIIYITLQEWYKKNYEGHLFKNKDDLFNLINFIYNSRTAGLKDSEIRKKLESSGWKGEQITYAFRKIDGKRTGMWEIPLFGARDRARVKTELMRRHPEGLDARFINQTKF